MTDNEIPPFSIEQEFAEQFWENLGTGGKPLQLSELAKLAMQRPITPQDVYYLLGQYAYLDICNADAPELPGFEVPFTSFTAPSGWIIQDRGDRLTAGIGRYNFGAYKITRQHVTQAGAAIDEENEDSGGESGGDILSKPQGTIVQQCFDTAAFMIELISKRWVAAEIVGGYRPMQRAAWIAAKNIGLIINYGPTAGDQQIYETLTKRTQRGRGYTPN